MPRGICFHKLHDPLWSCFEASNDCCAELLDPRLSWQRRIDREADSLAVPLFRCQEMLCRQSCGIWGAL